MKSKQKKEDNKLGSCQAFKSNINTKTKSMIHNKISYIRTKTWLKQYETSVKLLNRYADLSDVKNKKKIFSLKSQIRVMKREIDEYLQKNYFLFGKQFVVDSEQTYYE